MNYKMMYQGRYDPFRNMVSVIMPIISDMDFASVSPDDMPNRLVNKIRKEFSGASIWAYSYFDSSRPDGATQII